MAAGSLCTWVRNIAKYHEILNIVRPKIAKKEATEALVLQLEDQLKAMQDEYAIKSERSAALEASFAGEMEE